MYTEWWISSEFASVLAWWVFILLTCRIRTVGNAVDDDRSAEKPISPHRKQQILLWKSKKLGNLRCPVVTARARAEDIHAGLSSNARG